MTKFFDIIVFIEEIGGQKTKNLLTNLSVNFSLILQHLYPNHRNHVTMYGLLDAAYAPFHPTGKL